MNLTDCVNALFDLYKTGQFDRLEDVLPRAKGIGVIAVPENKNEMGIDVYVLLKDPNFQDARSGEVIVRGIYYHKFMHWVTQPKRGFSDMIFFRPTPAPEHHYSLNSVQSPSQKKISLEKSASVIVYYRNSD